MQPAVASSALSEPSSETARHVTVRALLLGDRIETAGLERRDVLSTSPLAFRIEGGAFLVLFRFGVVVLFGMSPPQEDEIIRSLYGRIVGRFDRLEEELAQIEIVPDKDEQITANGTIALKALLPEHVLIIADAIATNLILAHDERNVSTVFDSIEPLARELAEHGRTPGGRRTILKHIGNALLVQQRVSGLVAVAEKPDVLWERADLERFYSRLEGEYELKERADLLTRKLTVISDTAQALADIIDTERSLRLERIIIALILIETIFAGYQIFVH
ncbi:MAG TPA: RMD1 family protein [Pseudolabrys sp.]|nr:RMD1 family protein [Pseudolabrys sp.]